MRRRERDEGWFTGLYHAHHEDIVGYGTRRLGDVEAAADLTQEVFAVAWRRRDQVPEPALPWLYGVARRVLSNEWRRRRARPTQVPLADSVLAQSALGEITPEVAAAITDVWAALARLSEGDQEILKLIGWEQLTLSEAATVLGCRPATAAVRLHRARRRLRVAIEPSELSIVVKPEVARP